jgi:tRNA nucleotidyltransferase/poly(A) polymerase
LDPQKIIDEVGGLSDIQNKIIRLNGPDHFKEDPLRMLRAFRSAAELGFTISPKTLQQIEKDHALIVQSAGERVREELDRLLATSQAYESVCQMDNCGLLTAIFPELEAQRTCAEVYYGKGGVLRHTLLVLKRMEYLLDHVEVAFARHGAQLFPFAQNKALCKMAALLHDVDDPKLFKTKNNANARTFLATIGITGALADQICETINAVSFSQNKGKRPETIEAMIVQDADRLDAMGAIGIARTFAYGGEHGRPLADSIKHFYDKLLLLKDLMNTETGKKIAEKRHKYLLGFLKELEDETGG